MPARNPSENKDVENQLFMHSSSYTSKRKSSLTLLDGFPDCFLVPASTGAIYVIIFSQTYVWGGGNILAPRSFTWLLWGCGAGLNSILLW